jgi:hypothetical protein
MDPLVLARSEFFAVVPPATVPDPSSTTDLIMPNLMHGHWPKVLKVSEPSTSVEKFDETLDNGASRRFLPCRR